ncbi:hypothetical protein [Paraglaciecola chathamensis]|jgi:hypothetical protein|uniref:Uncharacterized protein n=3 Tax=Paraglaciecola chathamensis TaxID=368405 RepID=A0A8H9I8Y6_9ALTE|nr:MULTISPECIES: hypothetical protein [Paraglaciecola]AEE23667.1 hypothetical protein Glaag_2727 [Glaciecola sp. 4H-3-7+YE-5]MBN28101.1 hypothetical protein [Alteromonadaceae bacterium]MBJ2138350.1 hypothetical protein [Paraglaciecola chathamensis]MBU3016389.1 hypothetical protein [Paraglaciecola agarilytica]MDO6559977.1 hypothetical protein [Paraglaciecola chathamensis]|tara:strand:- start:25676 stop:26278 length:603 start_codon:yes stop_codon:yes gene_type:complete
MKAKIIKAGISLVVLSLAGCKLIPENETAAERQEVLHERNYCLYKTPEASVEQNCDVVYWLNYWLDGDEMTWAQRKAEIALLSDSPQDLLRKVLLCQGKDTPYQDKLRSQSWALSLIKEFDGGMQDMLSVMIYHPSQVLLESESAVVTLSKINGGQSTRIEEQQALVDQQREQIEEQRSQIEQLLKIEASIMDNAKGDPK